MFPDYAGKYAWIYLRDEHPRKGGRIISNKIVSVDALGVWVEQPNFKMQGVKDEYSAEMAHALIRWDFIAEIVVFYKSDRSPTPDEAPIGFR